MKILSAIIAGFFLMTGVVFAQTTPVLKNTVFQEQRKQAVQKLQEEKDNFQKNIEAKKAVVVKEVEAQKAELKIKVSKIKDQVKQATLIRIYESVNELNKRTTDQLQKSLNQIADVLDRVKSRTDKAQANGVDVSVVRTAIASAETAIATARAAVTAQAGKSYAFPVGTEATLKNDVKTARQTLHADLVKVRDLVKAVRDATHQAAIALGKIQGVDEMKEPNNKPL